MNEGSITGNTSSSYGGGVCVGSGSFTLSGGNITGNTSSSSGGGVYVGESSTFTMSNNVRIDPSNEVCLAYYYSSGNSAITIAGAFSGSDTIAVIDLYGAASDWLGRTILRKDALYTGTIPVGRFALGNYVSSEYINGSYVITKTPITYSIDGDGILTNQ
jgi:parallel beta-helix repeat protein